MSISSLGAGLAGMQSFQRALDTSANNIANADTTGFQAQLANFQDTAGGGVSVSISNPTAPQSAVAAAAPSGTDLTMETVNSMQDQLGFELSAQVVKTADQTMGTLINISA